MPMVNDEDFAMGNNEKDYCCNCSRNDGSMQSYEEKLQSLSGFIMKMQEKNRSEAELEAKMLMSRLPAWELYNN